MSRRKITADERAEMYRLHDLGTPICKIAELTNCGAKTVRNVLVANGYKKQQRTVVPTEILQAIIEDYQNGTRFTDLSRKYSYSKDVVRRLLTKEGIYKPVYQNHLNEIRNYVTVEENDRKNGLHTAKQQTTIMRGKPFYQNNKLEGYDITDILMKCWENGYEPIVRANNG